MKNALEALIALQQRHADELRAHLEACRVAAANSLNIDAAVMEYRRASDAPDRNYGKMVHSVVGVLLGVDPVIFVTAKLALLDFFPIYPRSWNPPLTDRQVVEIVAFHLRNHHLHLLKFRRVCDGVDEEADYVQTWAAQQYEAQVSVGVSP